VGNAAATFEVPGPIGAESRMLRMSLQYTFEEFRESMLAHYSNRPIKRSAYKITLWSIAGFLMLSTAVLVLYPIMFSGGKLRFDIRALATVVLSFLPLAMLLGTSFGLRAAAIRGIPAVKLMLLMIAAVTLVIGTAAYLLVPATPETDSGSSAYSYQWYTWIFVGAIWLRIFSLYTGQRPYRKLWDGQTNLHAPKTIGISYDAVTFADALVSSTYRWPAFRRSVETPHLFLLYISDLQYHMIPKRGFETTQDLEEFRALVDHHINGRTQAFPVLQPASTPAAVPDPRA
jgi:hypothetical protein